MQTKSLSKHKTRVKNDGYIGRYGMKQIATPKGASGL